MGKSNPKQLVVEGNDDKFSIASLMGFHTFWADNKENAPVNIQAAGGVNEVLADDFLPVTLRMPGLKTLGIVLDADNDTAQHRYQRVRSLVATNFPVMPLDLPRGGLYLENDEKLRLGVWIMPDNSSTGDLETFLRYLVPNREDVTWQHAVESVATARDKGCPYKNVHAAKSNLYTWLAWQDPPGQSPGMSLTKKVLDPHGTNAMPFIGWFLQLYELPPLQAAAPTSL